MEDENKNEELIDTPSEEPLELEIEPQEGLNAEGSKKDLAKLLKKREVQIAVIGIGILLLLILIIGIFSNATGVLDVPYKENSTCENVKVVYDPYNEEEDDSTSNMDLESYVKAATYEYSKDIAHPMDGMYNFYYSLAIAVRTEVIVNDCEITYRDKKISSITSDDKDFNSALENSKGLVLTDLEENLLMLPVSDFCWSEKDEDDTNYHLYQKNLMIDFDFGNEHMANDIYANCECNRYTSPIIGSCEEEMEDDMCYETWVTKTDEENQPIECGRNWIHQDDTDGFSVLGAFYVMNHFGKDYMAILQYFAGNDIQIMTVDRPEEQENMLGFNQGNMSSLCNTSSSEANFMTFLTNWEGAGRTCDNGRGFLGENLHDGTITIGPGVTNYVISDANSKALIEKNHWQQYFRVRSGSYYIEAGDCVPKSIVEQIKINTLESRFAPPLELAALKYGVVLTQFQKDALISFNYNLGEGYSERLIAAYASNGYEGLWNFMKQFFYMRQNGVRVASSGLRKRRKGEFALFVTGDYTDQGLFYSRGLDNYDAYNSEGVLNRMAQCSIGESEYAIPLPWGSGYHCTSPYGYRIHPISGSGSFHSGLDLGVAGGTDILAAKDGVVLQTLNNVTGSTPSTGNYVKLKHEDGTMTAYYHMKVGSVQVAIGETVKQGQKIGEVGSTGASTGNHLHFIIYDVTGNTVDPYQYLDLSHLQDTSRCHN